MTWILILTFYASTLSKGDSSSMIAQEFNTRAACESAGNQADNKFDTLMKSVKYICVEK